VNHRPSSLPLLSPRLQPMFLSSLRRGLALALSTLALSPVIAQGNFAPIGNQVGGGDNITVTVPLSVPFTFPNGVPASSISISSNGRIYPGGLSSSDATESVSILDNGPPSINAYWDDLISPRIYFENAGSTAVITWLDSVEKGGASSTPFTMQVKLQPPSTFTIIWDERIVDLDGDCIIGYGEGFGSGSFAGDFNDIVTPAGLSDLVTYEQFGPSTEPFDLGTGIAPTYVTFLRTASNTYRKVGGVPIAARVEPGRESCVLPPRAITITEGFGFSYSFAEGGTFDDLFMSGFPVALGDESVSPAIGLPFPFRFPGGLIAGSIRVTSNGRILPGGSIETADPTPSRTELLNDPVPQICPLWADWDPASADTTGNVWVHRLTDAVSVTWQDIAIDFGPATGETSTFQAILFNSGEIEFHYRKLNLPSFLPAVIGLSVGGGVLDPGEVDVSAPSGFTSAAVLYEFFDANLIPPDPFDLDDRPNDGVRLTAITDPAIGQKPPPL
jgi:hypothetical protein